MNPSIIFLMETMNLIRVHERARRRIRMIDVFYVPLIGIGGDTAVWWKENVQVENLYHNKKIVDCKVYVED